MSFETICQFERDVTAIMPFRKRYLEMSPEQRDEEHNTVIMNTNVYVSMSLSRNDVYWTNVIEEADRRINVVEEAHRTIKNSRL